MILSPTKEFHGKKIFLLGGTGFLGKVTLTMLLSKFPNVGRIYLMVRANSESESLLRFWDIARTSPVFDPLRKQYGGAYEDFLRDKVCVVGGDIGEENLGYSPEFAEALAADIDIIINCSGNVTFNPALDTAIRTNVIGTQNVVAFARRMKQPRLVHVSTCFVAGNRSGSIWETEEVIGFFPRRAELDYADFSVERELRDCEALKRRVHEEANDVVITARFRAEARRKLLEEGRDPDDERALQAGISRERKTWIRQRLTDLGIERAQWWGWPNIYTYTKSLGEQVVAAADDCIRAIVRPSIVESAVTFPFPGWNEGFTTTAPLIFLALKGQTRFPADNRLILDITPVDDIASGLLAVSALVLQGSPKLVYQLSSGDTNPNHMDRIVTLLGLYKRKYYLGRSSGNKLINEILGRLEARTVSRETFEKTSIPMFNKAAKKLSGFLESVRPRWGGGKVTEFIDEVKKSVDRFERFTAESAEAFELFQPFMIDNKYVFHSNHIRELMSQVDPAERHLLPWQCEKLDWYDYWLNIHIQGLEKWVFPTLEEGFEERPRRVYTYRDLIELFETTAKRNSRRTALKIERAGKEEKYTYSEMLELAGRVAAFLASKGIRQGDRVLLFSENCPEWGMCYFGVLKAGAICVPIDSKSLYEEVVNIARSASARGVITSDELFLKLSDLRKRLDAAGLEDIQLWPFREVFTVLEEDEEKKQLAALPARVSANSVASLIFTSGTTGQPKGVMLSHHNFTSLVAKLTSIFDLDENDGLLSVLPLHHTFEFSAGFLLPLSRGCQITYLEELNGEALAEALKKNRVTAIVGVPALWELLHRRIMNKFAEQGKVFEQLMRTMMRINSNLRDKTPINLGPLFFYPVHKRLGGNIRYLISGGSALSETVLKDFHGLGFTLLEGYGLTEASPVLTVTRPSNKKLPGSVGKPLPGIDVTIKDPNEHGVGEVIARGPNIMLGYYQNEAATAAVLRNKWLYTGDLGRIDKDGNLYIVGRVKDVIVDHNGKNVYPDELEELYGKHELIKEFSVVGLPDGSAEKVACLVVPDYERNGELSRDEVRHKIEEHIRSISLQQPFHKRIKVIQFTDQELPRTATRKVKRREVIELIQRLQRVVKVAGAPRDTSDEIGWILDIVASVANLPRDSITADTRLDELGFDSLMYNELGTALEAAGAQLPSVEALIGAISVRDLVQIVGQARQEHKRVRSVKDDKQEEIKIPAPVVELGRYAIDLGQKFIYNKLLVVTYRGQRHIPYHTNFIVAPNHCSHLDMGLVKMALGDAGKELVALAAADYFFDTKYKRAYFENFTNCVPLERTGSLRKTLKLAGYYLQQGYNVLMFPEGTRSKTGKLQEFKATLGYLALNYRTGILPMYLQGTYEALPKGSVILKQREIGAHIGQFLSIEELEKLVYGLSRNDAYRLVTFAVRRAVELLSEGIDKPLDLEQVKEEFTAAMPSTEEVIL